MPGTGTRRSGALGAGVYVPYVPPQVPSVESRKLFTINPYYHKGA
jgi:hypothetical protein